MPIKPKSPHTIKVLKRDQIGSGIFPCIWKQDERVCVCVFLCVVHKICCAFLNDSLCLPLLLCPCPLPLLSVQPFLLWWRAACSGHRLSRGSGRTVTSLPPCLFPVSFRFRESGCKQEATKWQHGVNDYFEKYYYTSSCCSKHCLFKFYYRR